jgi:nucleoside-diphosphate-sugar epimerase
MNVFITGITGSVGHYVFDVLAADPRYHLYLLVRNPKKLKRDLSKYSNVTLVSGDLSNVHHQKELLRQMDYAVLIATSWGGFKEPWRQNVYATCRIMRAFDPQRMKKIIYFSTASILDRHHKPVEAIRTIGTNYIRSKFLMHKILPKQRLADRVVTVFPTWVYGGSPNHPVSHAATGLKTLKKFAWLARWFTFDFHFHFIHCQDIALLVKSLLENKTEKREYVLGNAPLSVGDFFREAAAHFGYKTWFQIPIPMPLIVALVYLKGSHPWDKYCVRYRHFVYDVLNCSSVGLPSQHSRVADLFRDID